MTAKLLAPLAGVLVLASISTAAAESALSARVKAIASTLTAPVRRALDLRAAQRSHIALSQSVAPDLQPKVEAVRRALSTMEEKVRQGRALSGEERVALKQMRANQMWLTSNALKNALARGTPAAAQPDVDALVRIVTVQKLDGVRPEKAEQVASHVKAVSRRLVRAHLVKALASSNKRLREPILRSWVDEAVSWGEVGYYRDFATSPLHGMKLPVGPYEHFKEAADGAKPRAEALVAKVVELGIEPTPEIASFLQRIGLNAQTLRSEFDRRNGNFKQTLGARGSQALIRSLATRDRRDLYDLVLE